jgi:hypothetical protein
MATQAYLVMTDLQEKQVVRDLLEAKATLEHQANLEQMARMVQQVSKVLPDVLAPQGLGVLQGTVVLQEQRALVGYLANQVLMERQGQQDLKVCQELQVPKAILARKATKVQRAPNEVQQVQWEHRALLETRELEARQVLQENLGLQVSQEKMALRESQVPVEHLDLQVRLDHLAL